MKRNSVKQNEVNLTETNRNEIDSKKIKLDDVSLPLNSNVRFLIFCKKNVKIKCQGFIKSG